MDCGVHKQKKAKEDDDDSDDDEEGGQQVPRIFLAFRGGATYPSLHVYFLDP